LLGEFFQIYAGKVEKGVFVERGEFLLGLKDMG
jgi:hypothetical protein